MEPEKRCYEIRLADDPERRGPGILEGVLMPYETRAADRPELFARDSLRWPEGGIILNEMHNRRAPITRFTPEVRDNALRVSIPLPDTQRGRDAALSVRNGTLRGFSVEFHCDRETRQAGVRVIEAARLVAAGLVDDPSYSQASVSVRAKKRGGRRVWL